MFALQSNVQAYDCPQINSTKLATGQWEGEGGICKWRGWNANNWIKETLSSNKLSFSKHNSFSNYSVVIIQKKNLLFKIGQFILMNSNNQMILLITLFHSIWNNLQSWVCHAIYYAWMVCLLHSKLQGKLFFLKGLVSLKCTKWQKAKGSWCLSNQDWAAPVQFNLSQPK